MPLSLPAASLAHSLVLLCRHCCVLRMCTVGKVKKGIHKLTGLSVAIKILEKERIVDLADVERVKREIHILTRVRHPNVIRLYEVIDSPRHIFLIMEFVQGGELFDYIVAQGRVQDEHACRIFHHILNGVDYVHNKNIIHRDLKPENILLTSNPSEGNGAAFRSSEPLLKLADFGTATCACTRCTTALMTPPPLRTDGGSLIYAMLCVCCAQDWATW